MVGTERGQRPERRRLRMPSAQTWETVIGIGYLVLGTNAMLLVGALPLVVLLVSTDPVTSWPALLGAGVLATPALTAGFAVFTHYSRTHGTEVIRTFWRSWAAHLRRSLAVGLLWTTTAVVLVVDVLALWGATLGAVLTPVFVVLFLLATATALLALVASVERPDARLRDVLRASLYLGLRRWYLTAVSFLVLGLLGGTLRDPPGPRRRAGRDPAAVRRVGELPLHAQTGAAPGIVAPDVGTSASAPSPARVRIRFRRWNPRLAARTGTPMTDVGSHEVWQTGRAVAAVRRGRATSAPTLGGQEASASSGVRVTSGWVRPIDRAR
ncbi:DUF624 domain-containing protein [Ruania alba]|nr:DUF624 domain-containing protein [Ruania alba]